MEFGQFVDYFCCNSCEYAPGDGHSALDIYYSCCCMGINNHYLCMCGGFGFYPCFSELLVSYLLLHFVLCRDLCFFFLTIIVILIPSCLHLQDILSSCSYSYLLANHCPYTNSGIASPLSLQSCVPNVLAFRYSDS